MDCIKVNLRFILRVSGLFDSEKTVQKHHILFERVHKSDFFLSNAQEIPKECFLSASS